MCWERGKSGRKEWKGPEIVSTDVGVTRLIECLRIYSSGLVDPFDSVPLLIVVGF